MCSFGIEVTDVLWNNVSPEIVAIKWLKDMAKYLDAWSVGTERRWFRQNIFSKNSTNRTHCFSCEKFVLCVMHFCTSRSRAESTKPERETTEVKMGIESKLSLCSKVSNNNLQINSGIHCNICRSNMDFGGGFQNKFCITFMIQKQFELHSFFEMRENGWKHFVGQRTRSL